MRMLKRHVDVGYETPQHEPVRTRDSANALRPRRFAGPEPGGAGIPATAPIAPPNRNEAARRLDVASLRRGFRRLGGLALQLDYDQIQRLIAGVLRLMSRGCGVHRVTGLDNKVL